MSQASRRRFPKRLRLCGTTVVAVVGAGCWSRSGPALASRGVTPLCLPGPRVAPKTPAAAKGRLFAKTPAAAAAGDATQLLRDWRMLPDGRLRGTLENGMLVEFEAQLPKPGEDGVVRGPGGSRYLLGDPAPEPGVEAPEPTAPEGLAGAVSVLWGPALAAVVGGLLLVGANVAGLQAPNFLPSSQPQDAVVTRTQTTVVETRRKLADGSEERQVDRTTRRERQVPGKPLDIRETTKKTTRKTLTEPKALPAPVEAPKTAES